MQQGGQGLFPFLRWRHRVDRLTLRDDFWAGLTGAIIVLPQCIAYAYIAGVPAIHGVYTAIITAMVAALFGSSWHLVSGPTAAISIVLMSVVGGLGNFEPSQYLSLVLSLTLLAGLFQLALGLLKLGSLVNFISHTVVVGFTAGAAILIATSQLKHLLGLELAAGLSFGQELMALLTGAMQSNTSSILVGLVTVLFAIGVRRINRRLPHLLFGLLAGSLIAWLLDAREKGVEFVGGLARELPVLAVPDLSLNTLTSLVPGAIAVALLGLVEAVSIARAIAMRSQQQIDGNQEFIGQGLSNVVGSCFGCYAGSGSFTRSGTNYDAGAKTPLAAVFAAFLLVLVIVLVPGITAWLPLPAMAGVILIIAWNLIDFAAIRHVLHSNRHEAVILIATVLATLVLHLEYAIYLGVLLSLGVYLSRTSRPRVVTVAPRLTDSGRVVKSADRFALQECPQLTLIRVDGSLFFGAVDHVQSRLRQLSSGRNGIKYVLLIGKGINFIDVAGAEMLVQEARRLDQLGGALLLCSFKGGVIDDLESLGAMERLGRERFHERPQSAIAALAGVVDVGRCASCQFRIFEECHALAGNPPQSSVPSRVNSRSEGCSA